MYILLYEFKLNHNAAEAARSIIKVLGDDSVKDRTVQLGFQKFRYGDMYLEYARRGHAAPVIKNNGDTVNTG